MADKALNIVEEYAQADIEAKIELIIRYYPNFLKIVDLHERELQYIIKQEKAYNRRKKATYAQYRQAQKEMKEMQTAKYNVDQFLRAEEQEHKDKQKKRERAR